MQKFFCAFSNMSAEKVDLLVIRKVDTWALLRSIHEWKGFSLTSVINLDRILRCLDCYSNFYVHLYLEKKHIRAKVSEKIM